MKDLLFGSINDAQDALSQGRLTSVELTTMVLDHCAKIEPQINAFLRLDTEQALIAASESDQRRRDGQIHGDLDGIPLSIKDQIVTRGLETTAGSRMLEGYIPPYDATVVDRLRKAGAVIIGKNNQDEFAMGSSTEHSAFGATHNPHDPSRVPGGSSGGSAAAVSAGEGFASLGTDTGGSIRQPASFCGVVGLKPTYGRVSRFGAIAFASSLDQIGPLTRTVRDSAIVLGAIAGPDPKDSTSAPNPVPDLLSNLEAGVRGKRIGVVREAFDSPGLDPAIKASVEGALQALERAGAVVDQVSLPTLPYGIAAYYVTCTAEASSNLARYDGVRYGLRTSNDLDSASALINMYSGTRSDGFGPEVKRRILLGTYALSAGYYDAYYLKAQKVRTRIIQDFDAAFTQFDVLCTPTSPVPPFQLGARTANPLEMYLADIYTISCNLAGLCGISVPLSTSEGDLPIGIQFLGRPFDEETLLQVARGCEATSGGYQIPAAARSALPSMGGS
jgi:aspartyl-tRNA(Asn)/glutamyl-tRNA(Gln) amidotransferase subunit A